MTAAELIALHANAQRHPNALHVELMTTPFANLVRLAYGEHADEPLDGVPDQLASLAYDEIERRQRATKNLYAEMQSRGGI